MDLSPLFNNLNDLEDNSFPASLFFMRGCFWFLWNNIMRDDCACGITWTVNRDLSWDFENDKIGRV